MSASNDSRKITHTNSADLLDLPKLNEIDDGSNSVLTNPETKGLKNRPDPVAVKETRKRSRTLSNKKIHGSSPKYGKDYSTLKVYAVSTNGASRERLRKKIADSKCNDSVKIDWDAIMAEQQ